MKIKSKQKGLRLLLIAALLLLIGLFLINRYQTTSKSEGVQARVSNIEFTLTSSVPTMFPATAMPRGISYHVSPSGNNANAGTSAKPWKTIQKAVDTVADGNTVMVQAGSYAELVRVDRSHIDIIANGSVNMKGFFVTGDDNLVRGFIIQNPASDFGIRVTGDNNIIEKNNISNTKQDGIWFFGSGNRFVSNNIHDIVNRSKITNDPHVDCFQTWGPAENIVFEKNICNHTSTYGSNQIVMVSNTTPPVRNLVFQNNIFIMHDPGYSPMSFYHVDGKQSIANIRVLNNTIVHTNGMGASAIWFKNIAGAYAINNAFIDYGTASISYILVEGGSGIVINNNAVYKSDQVMPKGGLYAGDIWLLNAGMLNYLNRDFHLTASSPLIDRGADLSDWVIDDYENNARPLGSGYDIGAYEYHPPE